MNTEIDLQQGSDEWLTWRSSGFGSSEISAIFNVSKYMRPHELFLVKSGQVPAKFKTNPGIERGKYLEPIARRKFSAWYNLMFDTDEIFKEACLQMVDLPYMRTSLDGRSFDKTVNVEIKYQGKKAHDDVSRGIVDKGYYLQMQHQMIVSGARTCYLCSINMDEQIAVKKVEYDEPMAELILKKCAEFWAMVEAREWAC